LPFPFFIANTIYSVTSYQGCCTIKIYPEVNFSLAILPAELVLHLDLSATTEGDVVQTLVTFIEENDIQVLNVAGSRGSRDPVLYDKVFKIMVGALRS